MKITIFGSGYVGLVTGACLADAGNSILCMDIDAAKISMLQKGEIPIYEPGLDTLLKKNIAAGNIKFTTDDKHAVEHAEIIFIAVGTPSDANNAADLSYVLNVARMIGQHMQQKCIIVDKSTVPVGTADKVKTTIEGVLQERNVNFDFAVVSNPEFLKEGAAINDFNHPDRVVIGTDSLDALAKMQALYANFVDAEHPLINMDIRSAEMTKYAANAMLALRISFMNELSNVAERVDADIELVRQGIAFDKRIGPHFLLAGCGYGGSCFPKDVRALMVTGREVDYETNLIRTIDAVNEQQKHVLFNKLLKHFNGNLSGKTLAVWGLAFKPNTDDMREAASRVLIDALLAANCKVQAYDPVAIEEAEKIYAGQANIVFSESALAATNNADALAIVTEWQEFRDLQLLAKAKTNMAEHIIVDGRNLFVPEHVAELGFKYYSIGRKVLIPE